MSKILLNKKESWFGKAQKASFNNLVDSKCIDDDL